MKKEYSVERNTVMELLNDLDEFETKMLSFIDKYPTYKYTVNIKQEGNIWVGEVKIEKDGKNTIT